MFFLLILSAFTLLRYRDHVAGVPEAFAGTWNHDGGKTDPGLVTRSQIPG